MTNRDASDWDPLPATETGWHPGETPMVVPANRADAPALLPALPVEPPEPVVQRAPCRPGLRLAEPAVVPARLEPRSPVARVVADVVSSGPKSRMQGLDLATLMKSEAPPTQARRPSPVVGVAVASSAAVARPRVEAPPAPLPAGVDAREQEAWFRQMPVVEQVRLRRAWLEPDAAAANVLGGAKSQQLLERFWVAYVVFFLAALPLMLTEGMAGFVRMALAGCVTGLVWQVVPHTRRICAGSAVAVYLAVSMLPRLAELASQPFDLLVGLGGAVIVGYLSALGAGQVRRTVPVADAD